MKTFSSIQELQHQLNLVKTGGKTIGFVPTMGALHDGHLSLIKESNRHCDATVTSIFVNPTQFNNPDDLEKYPRNLAHDLELIDGIGCDYVFTPTTAEMYPEKAEFSIDFGDIAKALEGKHRPGHFDGVGLVVSKLLNIVRPTHAFFGQKDLQQFYIIKKLIEELSLPVNLIRVPIVREDNGLAMSSRNERLSSAERKKAGLIYQTLIEAKRNINNGSDINSVKDQVNTIFAKSQVMSLEYFEVVETDRFSSILSLDHEEIALCIAASIRDVRLIDNMLLF